MSPPSDRDSILQRRRRLLVAALTVTGCGPSPRPEPQPAPITTSSAPKPPPEPALSPAPPPQVCLSVIPEQEIYIIHNVYFDSGSAELESASGVVLDEVAGLMDEHPALELVIVGHCDVTEGICASAERAEAVKAALEQRGVGAERLSTRDAMAGELAVDLGGDRAKNRRVSFEVE